MFTNYTEEELLLLIANRVEENIHLDYKSGDALQKTDGKKKELSKDVSAFANSDGGTIIYGIKEFDEAAQRHLPEKIDAIDRINVSKEWIEQVINSNIQPKITGILITPIQLLSSMNDVVYVVTIPKSNTAHQASDKKYYKRYNFESVPMEDYEIKDIINRQSNPDLHLVLDPTSTTYVDEIVTMPILLINSSIKMAKDVKLTLLANEPLNLEVIAISNLNDLSGVNQGRKLWGSMYDLKIYKGLSVQVGTITFKLLNNVTQLSFATHIYADNMEPISNSFILKIDNGNFQYHLT